MCNKEVATITEVENTKHTVKGLCKLARQLGYKDPCFQLMNNDGSVVGDMLYFFEDNPGAVEAVVNWVLENHYLDDDEDDEDEEEG